MYNLIANSSMIYICMNAENCILENSFIQKCINPQLPCSKNVDLANVHLLPNHGLQRQVPAIFLWNAVDRCDHLRPTGRCVAAPAVGADHAQTVGTAHTGVAHSNT